MVTSSDTKMVNIHEPSRMRTLYHELPTEEHTDEQTGQQTDQQTESSTVLLTRVFTIYKHSVGLENM